MRVLLASAPHADTFGYSMPPPGLLRLGGTLLARGVDVRLEDLAQRLAAGQLPAGDGLGEAAARWLLREGTPDVLGLSVMGATVPIALVIAQAVRRAQPATRILLGGPGTTGVDEALLERAPFLDAVVRGEGEATLPEVLERFAVERDLAGIDGVTWRDATGRVQREAERRPLDDLEQLAPYAWELLPPLARYKQISGESEGLTPIDSGRGCVYDCSFCTIGRFWSRRSRPLPVRRLVQEVLALRQIPGARNAYLCHDLFGADRRHALEFCAQLEQRGAPVAWECRARVDHMDAELLDAMARAGCYRVLLGVESGAAEVRRRANKACAEDLDVLGVVDACARVGITPILSLLLGLPGEGEAQLAQSLDLCAAAALRAGVNLSLHLVNPQPGCGLGEEFAGRSRPLESIPPDMAWGAGESKPERAWIDAHPDLFSTWHLLPHAEPHLRELADIARELPQVLMRYPRCFALLRRFRNCDGYALLRSWKEGGTSFESFVRAHELAVLDDVLVWEQALVRSRARGPLAECGAPRPAGELLTLRHDPTCIALALKEGRELPEPSAEPTRLCVVARRGPLPSVATLRITPDVARLLQRLDGQRTLEQWEALHKGAAPLLLALREQGLVACEEPRTTDPAFPPTLTRA